MGIEVAPAWRESFETFVADVGERPSPRHTLDRWPDPYGPYSPDKLEQANNRRTFPRAAA